MASNLSQKGRFKRKHTETSTQNVLKFFKSKETAKASSIASSILDEIIQISVLESEKSVKKHSGDSVSVKTIQSWKNKFPWLIIEGDGNVRFVLSKMSEVFGLMWALTIFKRIVSSVTVNQPSIKRQSNLN